MSKTYRIVINGHDVTVESNQDNSKDAVIEQLFSLFSSYYIKQGKLEQLQLILDLTQDRVDIERNFI